MINLLYASSTLIYLLGIWLALWNTWGDILPDWGRIEFVLIVSGIPFLMALAVSVIAVSLITESKQMLFGIFLLVCSWISAGLLGPVIVPMLNF